MIRVSSSPADVWTTLLLLFVLVAHHDVSAFPTLLVNSCERNLQVGEVIMGVAVAPSGNAPAAQSHTLDVLGADAAATVCGATVEQGQELALTVDPTLVGLVAAPGWSPGVGPNFIVEATNAIILEDSGNERGCGDSRAVNPAVGTPRIVPLEAGETVVRLLSAYGFGQVWASPECTLTVTGTRTVARHAGFVVDQTSWQDATLQATLSTEPYTLTAQQLLQGASSGFSVLEQLDDGTFAVKYDIAADSASQVTTFLQTLQANETDIQVSIVGFEAMPATTVDVLLLTRCTSSATCDGFFNVPTDLVCLGEGLCIESSVVDEAEGTITVTIVSNDDSWFAVGFTSSGGGMTGGGSGSDVFACSEEGLRRFLITARSNPSNSAASTENIDQDDLDDELVQNLCVIDTEAGTGRMVFTRALSDGEFRPISPGTPQAIIWARGPAGTPTLTAQHPQGRRAEVSLDLTNLEAGASTVQQEAERILWCHIVFMSLSWGFCLPLAVVIASRTRNVTGGRPGAWFQWHKALARIGWTLQTIGALCGIYYCEVYADHLQFEHTKLGVFIVIAGFLQPISAILRVHPPKDGWPGGKPPITRTLFEVYHKGIGWVAMICGIVNVFLGADLVKDLGFEDVTKNVPIAFGTIGTASAAIFFTMSFISYDNFLSQAITGATGASPPPPAAKPAEAEA